MAGLLDLLGMTSGQGGGVLGNVQDALANFADPMRQERLLALQLQLLGAQQGAEAIRGGGGQPTQPSPFGSLNAPLVSPNAPPDLQNIGRMASQIYGVGQQPQAQPSESQPGLIGQFGNLIKSAAASVGLDPGQFARQLRQESGFNPNAVSPAGAQGIAQFMPATAKERGVEPFKPESAIPGAAGYMADLKKQFGNDGLALAAYNWGPGNLSAWLKAGANPLKMPEETRNYVQNITGKPITAFTLTPMTQVAQAPTVAGTAGITAPPATLNNPEMQQFRNQLATMAGNPFLPKNTQDALKASVDALSKSLEPTNEIKNYRLYVQQTQAAGQKPISFEDWQQQAATAQQEAETQRSILGKFTTRLDSGLETANSAVDALKATNDLRAQLDAKAGIFSGQFAKNRLALSKFMEFLGKPTDPRTINTETFQSTVGQQVAALVKNFGSGTSITNQDREYAEKMAAGDISLEEGSIRRVFDILDKLNRGKIERHNQLVDKVAAKAPAGSELLGAYRVDMPQSYQRNVPELPTFPRADLAAELIRRGVKVPLQ